jgi:hypothetical protein
MLHKHDSSMPYLLTSLRRTFTAQGNTWRQQKGM